MAAWRHGLWPPTSPSPSPPPRRHIPSVITDGCSRGLPRRNAPKHDIPCPQSALQHIGSDGSFPPHTTHHMSPESRFVLDASALESVLRPSFRRGPSHNMRLLIYPSFHKRLTHRLLFAKQPVQYVPVLGCRRQAPPPITRKGHLTFTCFPGSDIPSLPHHLFRLAPST